MCAPLIIQVRVFIETQTNYANSLRTRSLLFPFPNLNPIQTSQTLRKQQNKSLLNPVMSGPSNSRDRFAGRVGHL